jgi:hypothetical protein
MVTRGTHCSGWLYMDHMGGLRHISFFSAYTHHRPKEIFCDSAFVDPGEDLSRCSSFSYPWPVPRCVEVSHGFSLELHQFRERARGTFTQAVFGGGYKYERPVGKAMLDSDRQRCQFLVIEQNVIRHWKASQHPASRREKSQRTSVHLYSTGQGSEVYVATN